MAIIINMEGGKRFTCSDAADCDCEWEARGKDEDEILAAVERHGQERHNRRELTETERNRIRAAIRGNTAA
jgi:predicted small metal-binding protein